MKRRKLNLKGKILVGIVAMFVVVAVGNIYMDYYKQQIKGCVKAGHSRQYCEFHLSK